LHDLIRQAVRFKLVNVIGRAYPKFGLQPAGTGQALHGLIADRLLKLLARMKRTADASHWDAGSGPFVV
jgi:hypothetical protein